MEHWNAEYQSEDARKPWTFSHLTPRRWRCWSVAPIASLASGSPAWY